MSAVTAPVSLMTRLPEEDVIVAPSLSPPVPFSVRVPLPLLMVLPAEDVSIPADPELVVPLIVRLPLERRSLMWRFAPESDAVTCDPVATPMSRALPSCASISSIWNGV